MRKSSPGFTLVELLVAITASVLVIAAASTFMLFGMRMEKASSKDATLQSESRIILNVLETIAAEMSVTDVKYIDGNNEDLLQDTIDKILIKEFDDYYRWELYATSETGKLNEETKAGECVLSFDIADQAIRGKDKVIIIDDIAYSTITYSNRVLQCEIETTSGESYYTSVYCRVGSGEIVLAEIEEIKKPDDDSNGDNASEMNEKEAYLRDMFLENLAEQYGSTGKIYDDTIFSGYEFATWYWAKNMLGNMDTEWATAPETVPWCAIFVSWGLSKTVDEYFGELPYYLSAQVDSAMWYQFDRAPNKELCVDEDNNGRFSDAGAVKLQKDTTVYKGESLGDWHYPYIEEDGAVTEWLPNPGDIVFFENTNNGNTPMADHVGVVVYVNIPQNEEGENEPQSIFVIEGNNNDRVGIFEYTFTDGVYVKGNNTIIGYGVVDWYEIFDFDVVEIPEGYVSKYQN